MLFDIVSYRKQGFAIRIISCFFLCAFLPVVSPQVVINSTISDGDTVCPGQVITFTCETRGSEVLVWTSNDYIGQGSRLEFADFNNLNLIHMGAITGTVATFINNTIVDGTIVLVSQLKITVSEAFSNPSVSCVHVRDDTSQTINFQSIDNPEMPQGRILAEQRRHTVATDSCMLHLAWNSPLNYNLEYLSGYMVNIDGENIANKTDDLNASFNLFALLLYCKNYSVSLQAVSLCDQVSDSTPTVTVAPRQFIFSQITPDHTTVAGGSPESSESTAGGSLPVILGVLLAVAIVIIVGLAIILGISLFCNCKRNNRKKSEAELK